jgi:uncharacterized MAPEG superfamily protein
MTLAFWSILVVSILPIICAGLAKSGGRFDNAIPRAWLDRQTGWRQRADWAQRNHYEVFPPFAAGVVVAHIAHARQGWIDALAILFVLLRIAYTAAYILDKPSLRSLLWCSGFGSVAALFLISA